jgi:hypothetical protein
VRRRINAFLGQLTHINLSEGIALRMDAPPWAVECVTAVLTAFKALRKVKKMAQYCDKSPFAENMALDSPGMCRVRAIIFAASYDKFPRLTAEAKRSAQPSRMRSVMAKESDEITDDDVVAAAFLIPHIMRPEIVKDFVKAEVEIEGKLKSSRTENPADEAARSGEGDK